MIIYLVRHARPRGVEGICYGRQDVAVDENETARTAGAIRQALSPGALKDAPVYSSPLARCTTLARALAGDRAVTLTPALLELDFGVWQGRSWDDIPRAELDAWAEDPWGHAPGRGESPAAAEIRWWSWVDSLPRGGGADAVIAVTHAGLIRVAHASLTMEVGYGTVYPIESRAVEALP